MAGPARWRWAWWLLAWVSLGVGIVGIVLPVLPTAPFILLSAFAAARGSERLHAWLVGHPRFGPAIREWEAHGAVARRSKWLATATMAVTALVLVLAAPRAWVAASGIVAMVVVGTWLWCRPEPPAS